MLVKKNKKEPAGQVYVYYTRHCSGGDRIPGDDWMHEDSHIDFYVQDVILEKDEKRFYSDKVAIDFEPKSGLDVWVVVVRYTTVCTFGTVYGEGHILGVFEHQGQASKIQEQIYNDTYIAESNEYLPWKGYFESLEGVEIHQMKVE